MSRRGYPMDIIEELKIVMESPAPRYKKLKEIFDSLDEPDKAKHKDQIEELLFLVERNDIVLPILERLRKCLIH